MFVQGSLKGVSSKFKGFFKNLISQPFSKQALLLLGKLRWLPYIMKLFWKTLMIPCQTTSKQKLWILRKFPHSAQNKPSFCSGSCDECDTNWNFLKHSWNTLENHETSLKLPSPWNFHETLMKLPWNNLKTSFKPLETSWKHPKPPSKHPSIFLKT